MGQGAWGGATRGQVAVSMKLGGEAEATAWEDDGAQSPTGTHASMVPAWFCKFPGCGKGYASTDGTSPPPPPHTRGPVGRANV